MRMARHDGASTRSKGGAAQALGGGRALARKTPFVPAGEERKLVTVLFADLVGSTAFAGDRDAERVRVQLERFYDAMRAEIELSSGTVEKFAGDAVMAVFGAPAAFEDHAERRGHWFEEARKAIPVAPLYVLGRPS